SVLKGEPFSRRSTRSPQSTQRLSTDELSMSKTSRRAFVKTVVIAAAAANAPGAQAQPAGRVAGFDHVALPMQNVEAMVAFYRGLGFQTNETAGAVSVYVGDQMINFHRPAHWQDATFTLR